MRSGNAISAACTSRVSASRAITRPPRAGSAPPPSRTTARRRTCSAGCCSMAKCSRRSPSRAAAGPRPPPPKATPAAATRLGTIPLQRTRHAARCPGRRGVVAQGDRGRRRRRRGDARRRLSSRAGRRGRSGPGPFLYLTIATRRGSLLAARFLPIVRARLSPEAIRDGEAAALRADASKDAKAAA